MLTLGRCVGRKVWEVHDPFARLDGVLGAIFSILAFQCTVE